MPTPSLSRSDMTEPSRNRAMTKEERKVIIASSLGTVFEWYDFYLYGSLAVIIGAKFFGSRVTHSAPCFETVHSAKCT